MSGYHKREWEPFPMHTIKKVDHPTTEIHEDQIQRTHEKDHGFNRALQGDFGSFIQRERKRFATKHPLSAALVSMQNTLRKTVDGVVAGQPAPFTHDPPSLRVISRKLLIF